MIAPEAARPVVILPGFGNKSEDYTAPFGNQEASLASALERRGFTTYTVPVRTAGVLLNYQKRVLDTHVPLTDGE